MVKKGVFKNHYKRRRVHIVRTCAIYGQKGCFQESIQATTSAYSADIRDLWCKKACLKNTQNRHVGLKCGHVRFMVQKGVLEKHSKSSCGPQVRTCAIHGPKGCFQESLQATTSAYSADIRDLWCKKAFLKNTQNLHVGLKCGHVTLMVQNGVFKNHYKQRRVPIMRTFDNYGAKKRS